MTKTNVYLLIALLIVILPACSSNENVKTTEPKTAEPVKQTSSITAAHTRVPNSNLYIIAPPGFSADSLSGTVRKDSETFYAANFLVMKFVMGITADAYLAEMKKETEAKYPGTWKQEDLSIGGHAATIFRYQVMDMVAGYHLFFTDGSSDEMLVANYDTKDAGTGTEMYEAMKTVVIE